MNPPKAERAKPSLSSDYNLLFKNKIGESSLDIHRSSPYSLDDFLTVMRNQKAKIYEDLVVPMEATKKQNDFYKLARIKSSVSLPRQSVN